MAYERVEDWLRAQEDGVEVVWYCDGMDPQHPWQTGYADIHCDVIESACSWNWAWTITSPMDGDGDFEFPPDMVVYRSVDPKNIEWFFETAKRLGGDFTAEQIMEIDAVNDTTSPDAYWVGYPGWSPSALDQAIEQWCAAAGRSVKATWDADHGPSRFLAAAMESVQRMRDGVDPGYVLHPGEREGGEGLTVIVSDHVMEVLLALTADEEKQGLRDALIETMKDMGRPEGPAD